MSEQTQGPGGAGDVAPMSAERLAEIRSLLPVTEHPWGAFRHLDSDCPAYTIETDDVVVAVVADYMVGELDGAYRVCVETERRYDAESIANFVAASPEIVRELLAEVERLAGERDEARAAVEHLDLIIERLSGFAEYPRPDSLSAWNLRADELSRSAARIVGPLFEKWAPQEAAERTEGEADA